ncbi:hypothetical protein F8M41_018164, partial [Gigaspora margarita]
EQENKNTDYQNGHGQEQINPIIELLAAAVLSELDKDSL